MSSFFLVYSALAVFKKTDQAFRKMSLDLGLSDVFPHNLTGMVSFEGGGPQRGSAFLIASDQEHTTPTGHHWGVTVTWPRRCLPRFCTILCFLIALQMRHNVLPTLKGGRTKLYLLEGGVSASF